MLKLQFKTFVFGTALLCSVSLSTQGQVATNLAGNYRSVQFSVPSFIPIWRNPEGVVVNVGSCDYFETSAGQITVATNNSFTFTGEEVVTGNLVYSGQGLLTAQSGTNTLITFQINSGLDVMVSGGANHEGFADLELVLRNPASALPGEFLNTSWNLFMFETPARLVPQMYTNGVVYELKGRDGFSVTRGSMLINVNGIASGSLGGPFTASISYAGDGQVNLAISEGGAPFVLPLYMNAAKDFMVGSMRMLSSEDNFQQLILALRSPGSASLADLQGMWRVISFKTPRAISLVKDPQGDVHDLNGKDDFEASSDCIIAGHDGFFISNTAERARGTFTVDPSGLVQVAVTNTDSVVRTYTFGLNASKNVLAAVWSDSEQDELVLLTKAPAQPGSTQDFALTSTVRTSLVVLEWASGVNRELQSSTNLVDWEPVPGTAGRHSYSAPLASSGSRFYRVVDSAP